jgi:hypothetical protein
MNYMKKIFTLIAGSLLSLAVFAAGHQPTISITSEKNFRIVVDGKSYSGSNIAISPWDYYGGMHSIQVYDMQRGFFRDFRFGRNDRDDRARMISSTLFQLDRNDVMIHIDCFGRITVSQVPVFNQFDRDDNHQYDHRYMDQNKGSDRRDMNTRGGFSQQGRDNGRRF